MSLWAVTAYFNPLSYKARLSNYRCFRRHISIPLLTVEWSATAQYQLGDDEASRLVRVCGGDLMWQKERLLSIAVRHLPEDCDAILLIDADILLPDPSWPERLKEALRFCPVVQPFREVHHLPPMPAGRLASSELLLSQRINPPFYLARQSFADHFLHGAQPTRAPTVSLQITPERHQEVRRLAARPSFGHAWAMRRDWIERIGLYEQCVAGSGDLAFALAVSGRGEEFCHSYPLNSAQQAHYLRWAAGAAQEAGLGRLGRLDGEVLHLFHGHLSRRSYRSRLEVLAASGFDPERDLTAEAGHPFGWASSNNHTAQVRTFFQTYFRERAEDEAASHGVV